MIIKQNAVDNHFQKSFFFEEWIALNFEIVEMNI